jgi:hypothetical protein
MHGSTVMGKVFKKDRLLKVIHTIPDNQTALFFTY